MHISSFELRFVLTVNKLVIIIVIITVRLENEPYNYQREREERYVVPLAEN